MTIRCVEKWVYDRVKDNVGLKNCIKWGYQFLFSSLSRSRVATELILTERQQSFFGFHDKSPWSEDGTLLLGHTVQGKNVGAKWKNGVPIGISVFEGSHWSQSTQVARTQAWNWQQGAQLQWMGAEKKIVYNDFRDGVCRAVTLDLDTGREEMIKHPVAAVSFDGACYASVCFQTFGRAMNGYGYAFEAIDARSPVEPSTLIVKKQKGTEKSVCLADLDTELQPCKAEEGIDFFSHCLFSPNGQHLLFLRRQSLANRRLRSEMFCLSLTEGSIQRIAFKDMVSHFTWLGDERILAYANTRDGGDGFYVANVVSGAVTSWSPCLSKEQDGHPHATPSGDTVVFDTYPDRTRHQQLFIWREGDEQAQPIARLYSPMKFWGASRVDLHPRIRSDGEYVAFDAGYNGTRSLITARLP